MDQWHPRRHYHAKDFIIDPATGEPWEPEGGLDEAEVQALVDARTPVPGGTVVQEKATGVANTSPRTIVLDATPTQGNIIYLLTVIADTAAITPTQTGVTWTGMSDLNGLSGSNRIRLWKGVVGAGASATITVTRASGTSFWDAGAVEMSGTTGTQSGNSSFNGSASTREVAATPTLIPGAGKVVFHAAVQASGGDHSCVPIGFKIIGVTSNFSTMGYRLATATDEPITGASYMCGTGAWAALTVAVE